MKADLKMNRRDKAALTLFAVIVGLTLAIVFVCAIAPDIAESMGWAFSAGMKNYPLLRALVIAACLGLAVLLFGWVRQTARGDEAKKDEAQPVPISEDEGGRVQISQAALEALVRRSAGPIEGVNRFDVQLEKKEEALDVTLKMSVRQGVRIPELAREAQQSVREALEDMTGVKVENVTLLVSEITAETPAQSAGKGGGAGQD